MFLHPGQSVIAKDLHRFRVVCAGRRFGKSLLSVYELVGKALAKDGNDCAYIAPTFQMCRDIAWNELKKVIRTLNAEINESRLEVVLPTKDHGKSRIVLRGWESIETLRGSKFAFLIIDEIAQMRDFWENWQEVVRPTLTDKRGEALFISTPHGFNHFFELYNLEQKDSDFKSFHFTTYDNPFIPVDEIDKARKELTEDRFFQEYMADFRKTEGLVYKEFDRRMHLYSDLPEKSYIRLVGIDFGFTNPTAQILILEDKDNNYFVENEWYQTQQTNEQIKTALGNLSPNYVYPDPEAPEKILELKKANFCVLEVTKGKDSIVNGINVVRELFKTGRLKINQGCKNLIWELETYSYPLDRVSEIPEPENNHALDALRYALMTRSKTRIQTENIRKTFSFNGQITY